MCSISYKMPLNLTTISSQQLRFEWVVQPPANTSTTVPKFDFSLSFTLKGPWISDPEGQFQDEGLLFVVIVNPLRGHLRTPLEPTLMHGPLGSSPLPSPYDKIHANGFTFIPSTEVHAGRNSLSFSNFTFASMPGTYRLEVWAYVVTPRRMCLLFPGWISSRPIQCTYPGEMELVKMETILKAIQAHRRGLILADTL